KDFSSSDSILSVHQDAQPGFDLIIVSSLNPTPNINFRFTPGLSFQDRWVDYKFKVPIEQKEGMRKTIGSTYLNFPLLMKLRTNRINNCDAYAIGGYFYGLDMANNRDFVNNGPLSDHALRIAKADHGYIVGAGMDFYLQYFKFGFEIKLHAGVKNILLQDNSFFASPIGVLKSRCWTFALTFEG
ncbi:MAG: outer membrane beta-barrel protein, partial [Flavobacteriales bacterium]